jgi:uncharacterized integral membrane protein
VAEKPFRVILAAILLATVLLVLFAVVAADINCTPFTLMLLTEVELEPLTLMVVVSVVDKRRFLNTALSGPIDVLHSV